jgi:parallel beta-helix repeat protein
VARKATVVRAYPVVAGWNISDALVEGLTIDGNSEKAESIDGCRGAGIYLYACEGVTIRNCTVRNYRGDGISFQWASANVTVEDCLVEKCLVFGLHPGSDSHHCIVRRNRSTNNGGPGLFVCESVKQVLFEKNELVGNRGPGISIGCRDTDNLFRENTISGNDQAGVLFRDDGGEAKGAHRNVFEKNTVLDNGRAAGGNGPPACITIQGIHRGLVFRENTLGYTRREANALGIHVIDGPRSFISEANRFMNVQAEIRGPATMPSTRNAEAVK